MGKRQLLSIWTERKNKTLAVWCALSVREMQRRRATVVAVLSGVAVPGDPVRADAGAVVGIMLGPIDLEVPFHIHHGM